MGIFKQNIIGFLVPFFVSLTVNAHSAESGFLPEVVQQDIQALFSKAGVNGRILFQWKESQKNTSEFICEKNGNYVFQIHSKTAEISSTLYYHLRKLGFVFPHPRIQITPSITAIKSGCGSQVEWRPRLEVRGFHLHLQHPSEWVAGFFMGYDSIALDTIKWMIRNQQNFLQIVTLQLKKSDEQNLLKQIQLAKKWGLTTGLSGSFGQFQQRSYNMISQWNINLGFGEEESLEKNLNAFIRKFSVDFVSLDLGTSEFTKTKPEKTIRWMNKAAQILKAEDIGLYVKVHVSNNQHDDQYGNFNFLAQYADPYVGVQPHTVYFYGLNDKNAPFYGRKDYKDMKEFYLQESSKRPSLYFPETSYFVFMDVDAPLFLTDYLLARTDDVDWMQDRFLSGTATFTTGQELGYWLFDFQAALLADSDSRKNPYMALELIGEDIRVWKPILDWQNKYFKQAQVIQTLFFSNILDQVPFLDPLHEQILLKDIPTKKDQMKFQLALLKATIESRPDFDQIRNDELKRMMKVTFLRAIHSFHIRWAAIFRDENSEKFQTHLRMARETRVLAQTEMDQIFSQYMRYPEVPGLYSVEWKNPTSYGYGYLAPAKNLHMWVREEELVGKNISDPLYKSLVNPLRILLPREAYEALYGP